MAAILKILKYETQLQFYPTYEKIIPNYAKKSFFMMMTSSLTSQGYLKVGPLYSFINAITTLFVITEKRAKISSLNFLCVGVMRLWLHDDDVIADVTGLPQSRPSIFLYKCNNNTIRDTWKTSKDIIIKLPVRRCHEIMTTFILIHFHDIIHDVTRSQSRSNFEIDISPSIFQLERQSKVQNVGNANGYLSGIFIFRYNFR